MQQKNPKNISAIDLYEYMQTNSLMLSIVDVREDEELLIAPLPYSVFHYPLSKSEEWIKGLRQELPQDKPVLVLCHAGIRSWNFGLWLINQGWGYEVWNLEGGIDAWSSTVDSTVPKY